MKMFNRGKPSNNLPDKLATKKDIENLRNEIHPKVSEKEVLNSLTAQQRRRLQRIKEYNKGKR